MRAFLSSLILFLSICPLLGQNTVGLLSHDDQSAYAGYNLFFSHNQEKTILIDNNGQVVHYWDDLSDYRPGNSAYLLENGDLIRCKRPNSFADDAIWAGGGGAIVEIVDWEGNQKASFELNDENGRLHHDIEPMANGHILMIAWAKKDSTTAANAGRDPDIITQSQVWSEKVLEWDPVANEIVWEWDAFDHLVQDRFSDRANYGDVNANRNKIDINYDEHNGHPDWLHINSIDYNETLDQIVLSVPYFNEFWVIDHNNTTTEAQGEAGDLLYRWGNPLAYQSTEQVDQKLFFQHDVHWVDPFAVQGEEDYGKIMLFNNRLPDQTSVGHLIETIDPNTNTYFSDEVSSAQAVLATYAHPTQPEIAYSTGLSSVQRLANGNILMLSGRYGYAYELDSNGELVWEYRIPFSGGQVVPQGTVLSANNNITFRMNRLAVDHPAFDGRDLSPQGLLEEFEFPADDEVVTSIEEENYSLDFNIYPNPAIGSFKLEFPHGMRGQKAELLIFDLSSGQLVRENGFDQLGIEHVYNAENLNPGFYLIRIQTQDGFAMKKLIYSK